MGSAGGSAGGAADKVYFHPDTSKFDVVNLYIHAGGGDQGHHTRMGWGCRQMSGEISDLFDFDIFLFALKSYLVCLTFKGQLISKCLFGVFKFFQKKE